MQIDPNVPYKGYKPNSKRSKELAAKKKVDKVVNGSVRTKKKDGTHKLKDVFISEDAANVKNYVFLDVLVPAVKNALSDIVTDGINMILFGDTKMGTKKNRYDKVSYRSYSDTKDSRYGGGRTRLYDYEDVILDSRGEAENVLAHMDDIIDEYDAVSVADLYDLVGITGRYTDQDYGWTNIHNARAVRCRDGGWTLDLPKVKPLK